MNFKPSDFSRYNAVSQLLHWLTVVFILIMYATAWGRDLIPESYQAYMMPLHKSIGLTILAITVFRIFWRIQHRPPALPQSIPSLMGLASHVTHYAQYILLIAMPVCGWLLISARGRPMTYFWAIDVPNLVEKDRVLGVALKELHENGATIFFCLIGVHIAAALFHQFVMKDRLLDRMLPDCHKH